MGSGPINPKAWAAAPVASRRLPIIEQLAAELQNTGGTVSLAKHGAVFRGGNSAPWDMAREWKGSELKRYQFRNSNWSKTIIVGFYVEPSGLGGQLAAFILHLHPPLTDEEIGRIAETYLLILNLRRLE